MCAAFEIEAGWSFGAFKLLPRLKIVQAMPNTSDVLEIRAWPPPPPPILVRRQKIPSSSTSAVDHLFLSPSRSEDDDSRLSFPDPPFPFAENGGSEVLFFPAGHFLLPRPPPPPFPGDSMGRNFPSKMRGKVLPGHHFAK